MKNLLIISLLLIITSYGFGQNSDTTKVYWSDGITYKYMEWGETTRISGNIEKNILVDQWEGKKVYFNKEGKAISYDNFLSTYGQKEVDNITFAISLLYEGQELLKDNKNSPKTELIDYSRPNDIKVDTSIYIDFTSKETQLDSLLNSNALLNYYNLLRPPPHGGDPNYATIAVVVDANGKAIHTHIVEDVKNKCSDDPWKLISDKEVAFSQLIIDGKSYVTEYIFKIMDLMYCVPLVQKEMSVRKTFSFHDSTFEKVEISYYFHHEVIYKVKCEIYNTPDKLILVEKGDSTIIDSSKLHLIDNFIKNVRENKLECKASVIGGYTEIKLVVDGEEIKLVDCLVDEIDLEILIKNLK